MKIETWFDWNDTFFFASPLHKMSGHENPINLSEFIAFAYPARHLRASNEGALSRL